MLTELHKLFGLQPLRVNQNQHLVYTCSSHSAELHTNEYEKSQSFLLCVCFFSRCLKCQYSATAHILIWWACLDNALVSPTMDRNWFSTTDVSGGALKVNLQFICRCFFLLAINVLTFQRQGTSIIGHGSTEHFLSFFKPSIIQTITKVFFHCDLHSIVYCVDIL